MERISVDSRTTIDTNDEEIGGASAVPEKHHEDIKEIQLQLAGLELDDVPVTPYQNEILDEEEVEAPVETLQFEAVCEEQAALAIMDDVGCSEMPPPDLKSLIQVGPELIEKVRSIPNTMAFKIGEAAELVGVKQYVLRYWESEFEQLRPKKSKNGQRIYSRKDVETAIMIKKLLYEDRFSIEGARAALKSLKQEVKEEKAIIQQVEKVASAQERTIADLRQIAARAKASREIIMGFGI